jgi:hypothetical protein
MEVNGQRYVPAALCLEKEPQIPNDTELGGLRSLLDILENKTFLSGIELFQSTEGSFARG